MLIGRQIQQSGFRRFRQGPVGKQSPLIACKPPIAIAPNGFLISRSVPDAEILDHPRKRLIVELLQRLG